LEDAKGQPTGLPLELLRQLIMASDRAGHEFISWYLKSALETYQKVNDSVQTRLSDLSSVAMSPLNVVKNFLTRSEPSAAEVELEQLRRKVADLEARKQKPKPRRKRK
jgi:polyhydroxyalkanoate synthesis regulator phasin